ncbi:MAG: methyltransferase [Sediminibacterium sp.]|nr:methyltransferase [Sediminibacterium sp.]MDP1811360.1 methyltransferase [Sediminibacterium sp.]MDP3128095.1 methyltransferase [Sediminibacterium sp.]
MSNTYFRFKQFTVQQDRCAMKVCTDACLFGAWVGRKMTEGRGKMTDGRGLDIGAGTGLLSLMLAQQTVLQMDAIELDKEAAEQALENFEASPWKERLLLIEGDARLVHLGRKYDLIISNPPFFDNDLKSDDAQRTLALHSRELSFSELMAVIKQHLAPGGKFAVLLPFHRKDAFEKIALREGFAPEEIVLVKQTPVHAYFRVMYLFSTIPVSTNQSVITIREGEQYSAVFTGLLKDYYFKL